MDMFAVHLVFKHMTLHKGEAAENPQLSPFSIVTALCDRCGRYDYPLFFCSLFLGLTMNCFAYRASPWNRMVEEGIVLIRALQQLSRLLSIVEKLMWKRNLWWWSHPLSKRISSHKIIRPDQDVKLSGHVTWVGRSSAESTIHVHQRRGLDQDQVCSVTE